MKNDGGPAFPHNFKVGDGTTVRMNGLTLRDYFAAKAMQAAATNPIGANGFDFNERANWSYQQADAMLKARKQ